MCAHLQTQCRMCGCMIHQALGRNVPRGAEALWILSAAKIKPNILHLLQSSWLFCLIPTLTLLIPNLTIYY